MLRSGARYALVLLLLCGPALADASREVRFDLFWDWLPLSETLLKRIVSEEVQPVKIMIPNEHLGKPELWSKDLTPDQLQLMQKSLLVDAIDANWEVNAQRAYLKKWRDRGGAGREMIERHFLTCADYYAAELDFFTLKDLLNRPGIKYTTAVEGAVADQTLPSTSDRNVRWVITMYPFHIGAYPEITYFRSSIRAEFDGITLSFAETTNPTVGKLKLVITEMLRYSQYPGNLVSADPLPFELAAQSSHFKLELKAKDTNASSDVPAAKIELVDLTLKGPEAASDQQIMFRKIEDIDGHPVPPDQPYQFPVRVGERDDLTIIDLGRYRITDIPAGYELRHAAGGVYQEGAVVDLIWGEMVRLPLVLVPVGQR